MNGRAGEPWLGNTAQQGQAMAEFLVLSLFLLPLFIGILLVARYGEIKGDALQASRFVAWERAWWSEDEKSGRQIQDEVDDRFFAGQHRRSSATVTNVFNTPNSYRLVTDFKLREGSEELDSFDDFDPFAGLDVLKDFVNPDRIARELANYAAEEGDAYADYLKCKEDEVDAAPLSIPPLKQFYFTPDCEQQLVASRQRNAMNLFVQNAIGPLLGANLMQLESPADNMMAGMRQIFEVVAEPVVEILKFTQRPDEGYNFLAEYIGSYEAPCTGDGMSLLDDSSDAGLERFFFKYTPQGLLNTLGLELHGVYRADVTASAENVISRVSRRQFGRQFEFEAHALLMTDTWTPKSHKQYKRRVENLTATERLMVNIAVLPAWVTSNLGFWVPAIMPRSPEGLKDILELLEIEVPEPLARVIELGNFPDLDVYPGGTLAPFAMGCDSLYPRTGINRHVMPWTVGTVYAHDAVSAGIGKFKETPAYKKGFKERQDEYLEGVNKRNKNAKRKLRGQEPVPDKPKTDEPEPEGDKGPAMFINHKGE